MVLDCFGVDDTSYGNSLLSLVLLASEGKILYYLLFFCDAEFRQHGIFCDAYSCLPFAVLAIPLFQREGEITPSWCAGQRFRDHIFHIFYLNLCGLRQARGDYCPSVSARCDFETFRGSEIRVVAFGFVFCGFVWLLFLEWIFRSYFCSTRGDDYFVLGRELYLSASRHSTTGRF